MEKPIQCGRDWREWRRIMRRENKAPAYIVPLDTTLEELCRRKPRDYSGPEAGAGYWRPQGGNLRWGNLQALKNFREGARATPKVAKEAAPAEETLRPLAERRRFAEIARIRVCQISTVLD